MKYTVKGFMIGCEEIQNPTMKYNDINFNIKLWNVLLQTFMIHCYRSEKTNLKNTKREYAWKQRPLIWKETGEEKISQHAHKAVE